MKTIPDGRAGHVARPPRSPDLTLMDFSVWGLVKDRVFAQQLTDLDDLKAAIVTEFDVINTQTRAS